MDKEEKTYASQKRDEREEVRERSSNGEEEGR